MATDLHGVAVAAEQNLEQLATGLAQAGADEKTVAAISQMANVTRKVVTVLGKGQSETADTAPPPGPAAPPPVGQPPPGGDHGGQAPPPQHTIHSATAELHQQAQSQAGGLTHGRHPAGHQPPGYS